MVLQNIIVRMTFIVLLTILFNYYIMNSKW